MVTLIIAPAPPAKPSPPISKVKPLVPIGNDNVVNSGFVLGSVDLDGGVTTLDNKPTGVFSSGAIVDLGPLGLLTNEGLLLPGGPGNIFTTNVTGSFLQTNTSVYGLDLQFLDQTSDRINVTGAANAAGTGAINVSNPGLAQPGSHDTTILYATARWPLTAGSGLASCRPRSRPTPSPIPTLTTSSSTT